MKIELNGEAIETDAETLGALLEEYDYRHESVATAINGEFVARRARAETTLNAGDAVDVVAPIAGG